MSIFQSNYLPQSLVLAGSLSLFSGLAQAQPGGESAAANDIPQGRAGIATLCIEKRSYVDVNTKKIVTPTLYLDKIPQEGINTAYVEGNAIAVAWKNFLNPIDAQRKDWIDQTDIPTQFSDAVDVVKKLDKNKDGIVSADEFETGEKATSPADKKIDLGLLTSLACSGKYLTEGALNTVDVEQFPEMIQVRTELFNVNETLSATKAKARQDLDAADKKFQTLAIGSGIGGGLLLIGLAAALIRGRKSGTPPAPKKPEVKPATATTPATTATTPAAATTPAPAATTAALAAAAPVQVTTDAVDEEMEVALAEIQAEQSTPAGSPTTPTPPPLPPEI